MKLPQTSRLFAMPRPGRAALLSIRSPTQLHSRTFTAGRQFCASSDNKDASTHSGPGWKGRHGEDHVVNRDDKGSNIQTSSSHQGMKDHSEGKEGSDAISRKDEGKSNEKAEKDNPEAPQPVIGMNDERGGKGH